MAFLLGFVTMLHLFTLGVLLIATFGKDWWVWSSTERADLWNSCRFDNETYLWLCLPLKETEWLHAVQVLMILSAVFCFVSFLVFFIQLFIMSKGGLFYITGVCQAFAGLTTFTGVLIYTIHSKKVLEDSKHLNSGHFGYCYISGWVCVLLLTWSGIMYIYLRKKD
ncbi:epithelial membrane protein 3b (MAM blood group) isoform 1-T2 [Clarias gariepinus]